MSEDFLWVEKYRPKTIKETILPADLKKTFQQFVDQKQVPNLLLSGTAGLGKTTVARAMLEEIGCEYFVVNGSLNGNIDTLRYDIQTFAATMSFEGGRKYVILDEADYLNANSTQPALRNFMEEFSSNCGFILTCNYKNRIIPALHSRCSVVDFIINGDDSMKLAGQFFKRVCSILEQEGVKYDKGVVAEVINKFFPDFRRVLNELQRYAATGSIDSGILSTFNNSAFDSLIEMIGDKNFTEVRKWVAENAQGDIDSIFEAFYNNCSKYFEPKSIPELVLILAKYQYQTAFVSNQEINLSACMVDIMANCLVKK